MISAKHGFVSRHRCWIGIVGELVLGLSCSYAIFIAFIALSFGNSDMFEDSLERFAFNTSGLDNTVKVAKTNKLSWRFQGDALRMGGVDKTAVASIERNCHLAPDTVSLEWLLANSHPPSWKYYDASCLVIRSAWRNPDEVEGIIAVLKDAPDSNIGGAIEVLIKGKTKSDNFEIPEQQACDEATGCHISYFRECGTLDDPNFKDLEHASEQYLASLN